MLFWLTRNVPAAGTYAHDVQASFLRLLRAGGKIDIRQRIHLVHHDIAVIGTDTRRDTRDTLALEFTGDGMKLAALYVAFDRSFVEERCYHIYSVLVSDQDHFVCQKLRFEMQMKRRTIRIDD